MELIHIIKNVNSRYVGDLKDYFKKVMIAKNAYAGYHNVRHMLHVLWESYDGGVQMGLSPRDLRNLLVAAIYHDRDHTGEKQEGGDIVNIQRAIEVFKSEVLPEDNDFVEVICGIIRQTEFPYKGEPTTIEGAILRDADLSQTFSPVWIQSILYGLGKELEMSYEEMLVMQVPFLKNLKFSTTWGQHKFGPLIKQRIDVVEEMISLL